MQDLKNNCNGVILNREEYLNISYNANTLEDLKYFKVLYGALINITSSQVCKKEHV